MSSCGWVRGAQVKVTPSRSGGASAALARAKAGSVAHMDAGVFYGSVHSPPIGTIGDPPRIKPLTGSSSQHIRNGLRNQLRSC